MGSERKLDIFYVLKHVDQKDVDFYTKLTDEERKEFLPFLVARWMSGTYSARQIVFLNELVNPFTFSLINHKQLLWYLMTVCSSGKAQRYVWNKLPGKASMPKPQSAKIVAEYLKCSLQDAAEYVEVLTGNDILDIADEMGLQGDDLTKIRKEYKDNKLRSDTIKTKRTKNNKNDAKTFFEL